MKNLKEEIIKAMNHLNNIDILTEYNRRCYELFGSTEEEDKIESTLTHIIENIDTAYDSLIELYKMYNDDKLNDNFEFDRYIDNEM